MGMLELNQLVQNAQTTGNGTACQIPFGCKEVAVYIIGSAGVSAGAVQIETADKDDYAGTWAALGSPVAVTASTQKIVQLTGNLGAIRARISTTVVDGTVSVRILAKG